MSDLILPIANEIEFEYKGEKYLISRVVAEWECYKADSKRLDKLDAFEPSCLLDLIELHCVKEDKTVRQMVDWIYRNVEEQD